MLKGSEGHRNPESIQNVQANLKKMSKASKHIHMCLNISACIPHLFRTDCSGLYFFLVFLHFAPLLTLPEAWGPVGIQRVDKVLDEFPEISNSSDGNSRSLQLVHEASHSVRYCGCKTICLCWLGFRNEGIL